MKSVRIWIKPSTKLQLEQRGKFGDTWDSIIQRLLTRPKCNINVRVVEEKKPKQKAGTKK